MQIPSQLENPKREKQKRLGVQIVVFGAIASIALWFTVLAFGNPISPFTNPNPSFGYALVVCAPALFLSLIAIHKTRSQRKE